MTRRAMKRRRTGSLGWTPPPARVDIWTAAAAVTGAVGAYAAASRPFAEPWHVMIGAFAGAALPLVVGTVLTTMQR